MSHDKKRIRDLWNFVSIFAHNIFAHKNGKDMNIYSLDDARHIWQLLWANV